MFHVDPSSRVCMFLRYFFIVSSKFLSTDKLVWAQGSIKHNYCQAMVEKGKKFSEKLFSLLTKNKKTPGKLLFSISNIIFYCFSDFKKVLFSFRALLECVFSFFREWLPLDKFTIPSALPSPIPPHNIFDSLSRPGTSITDQEKFLNINKIIFISRFCVSFACFFPVVSRHNLYMGRVCLIFFWRLALEIS